ncbi:unnamed protein product, partial [Cyprideis torosa]
MMLGSLAGFVGFEEAVMFAFVSSLHHYHTMDRVWRLLLSLEEEGGAVAIHLCSQSENVGKIAGLMVENTFNVGKIAGLMVENTFTSIPHVARSMLNVRLVQHLPNFCYKN